MTPQALTHFDTIPKDMALHVYAVFADTVWGKKLETKPRYGGMFPGGWSVERWEKLLGPDANNLHHMHQSVINAAQFVADENKTAFDKRLPLVFSFEDAIILCTAGAVHDQAEVELGDIAYGLKASDMRSVEKTLLAQREVDFAPHLVHVDEGSSETSAKRIALYRTARKVAFGDVEEFLPGAFEAIEKIGFLNNCVHALELHERLQRCQSPADQPRCELELQDDTDYQTAVTALRRVVVEVLGSNVFEGLVRLTGRFASLNELLHKHAATITAGMDGVTDEDFVWYVGDERIAADNRQDEPQRREGKFAVQRDIWRRYVNQSNIL